MASHPSTEYTSFPRVPQHCQAASDRQAAAYLPGQDYNLPTAQVHFAINLLQPIKQEVALFLLALSCISHTSYVSFIYTSFLQVPHSGVIRYSYPIWGT